LPPPDPTAASISVRQTLDLLDGVFANLCAGVERGEYALWLGSAISRERVSALNGVLSKLVEFLRSRIDPANLNCPFQIALDRVLRFATLSAEEKGRIDLATNSATWPDLPIILQRLATQYSHVLDVTVAGQPAADYLLWEGIDFVHTFANEEPDAEHLCVGVLALEGVISEIVSANWDGLLEAAAVELRGQSDFYRVCVTGIDFRGPAAAARLLKFHGCALRAIEDEAIYRPLLIARWSQIVGWAANHNFEMMKQELAALAARARTLMIGMSAQDPNIQQLFQIARGRATWQWAENPPPHVFAEDEIGEGQRTILQISYEPDFHAHEIDIVSRSCIRAFGKPLLAALMLNVIFSKYCALLSEADAPHMRPADFARLCAGLERLRNLAAEAAEPDRLFFVRAFVRHSSRARAMLQDGQAHVHLTLPYRPISDRPIHQTPNDANLRSTGQREAANALALLGLGLDAGDWTLTIDDPGQINSGAIRVRSALSEARVIFVAHGGAALNLFDSGVYREDDDDVIIIHSTTIVTAQQRSPSRTYGRPGRQGARHVDMSQLLRQATSAIDLQDRFRNEASI
jgi:hypothetical protein